MEDNSIEKVRQEDPLKVGGTILEEDAEASILETIEESCDFSEANMMEHAAIAPISLSPSKNMPLFKRVLSKMMSRSKLRFDKITKKPIDGSSKFKGNSIDEEEDTIIEYDIDLSKVEAIRVEQTNGAKFLNKNIQSQKTTVYTNQTTNFATLTNTVASDNLQVN